MNAAKIIGNKCYILLNITHHCVSWRFKECYQVSSELGSEEQNILKELL